MGLCRLVKLSWNAGLPSRSGIAVKATTSPTWREESGAPPGCFVMSTAKERTASDVVEVFWRPGCPFCADHRLQWQLRAFVGPASSYIRESMRRVKAVWRNIWQDEEAAALVRLANEGNETVPTIRVGTAFLTNPSGRQVARLIRNAERSSGDA